MNERVKFPKRPLSPSAIEDAWLQRATVVAIERARAVVSGGALPPNTPIGRLSDVEWGWIIGGVLFGWIETRAEQATKSGMGSEPFVRDTKFDPDPWDIGAIASILPELASSSPMAEMSKPLFDLSRDEMLAFLNHAFGLIRKAMEARDQGQDRVTQHKPNGSAMEPGEIVGLPFC
jgi:hypothetical protein